MEKIKSKKKIIKIAAIVIGGLFLIWSLVWYFTSYCYYMQYDNALKRLNDYEKIDAFRASAHDDDGYNYSVKYPSFLSWTGNIAISEPMTEDYQLDSGLIVWFSKFEETEYGVILCEQDLTDVNNVFEYQLYITSDGSYIPYGISEDERNEEILNAHSSETRTLLDKLDSYVTKV